MATKIFSQEDADISKISITSSRKTIYKDIDLSFTANNIGSVFKKTETAAVKQAVKNILISNRFDKPFDPDFGVDLRSYLFELADENTAGELIERIKSTIEAYEPRAIIRKIDVKSEVSKNSLTILLKFQVRNTDQTVSFETTVSRLR
jgi:phage baseplate assembly protein W